MKKILLLLLLFLVSPVSAENAIPFCTSMTTKIRVRTKIGNPQYISLYSKEDFLKKAGVQASPYTLGLTVAKPMFPSAQTHLFRNYQGKFVWHWMK